jgi:uncharacterized protein YbaR (Trm112 family)
MNPKHLDILACPACKGPLTYDASAQQLVCGFEKMAYPIQDGIMLLEAGHAIDLRQAATPQPQA